MLEFLFEMYEYCVKNVCIFFISALGQGQAAVQCQHESQ